MDWRELTAANGSSEVQVRHLPLRWSDLSIQPPDGAEDRTMMNRGDANTSPSRAPCNPKLQRFSLRVCEHNDRSRKHVPGSGHLEEIAELAGRLSDEEFGRHELVRLLLAHGSRPWGGFLGLNPEKRLAELVTILENTGTAMPGDGRPRRSVLRGGQEYHRFRPLRVSPSMQEVRATVRNWGQRGSLCPVKGASWRRTILPDLRPDGWPMDEKVVGVLAAQPSTPGFCRALVATRARCLRRQGYRLRLPGRPHSQQGNGAGRRLGGYLVA